VDQRCDPGSNESDGDDAQGVLSSRRGVTGGQEQRHERAYAHDNCTCCQDAVDDGGTQRQGPGTRDPVVQASSGVVPDDGLQALADTQLRHHDERLDPSANGVSSDPGQRAAVGAEQQPRARIQWQYTNGGGGQVDYGTRPATCQRAPTTSRPGCGAAILTHP
jgi:hypothetical protein